MTFYNQNNTKWLKDNEGAYIKFARYTTNIEISLNFENILGTSEVIDTVTATSTLPINTSFAYYLPGRVGNYELAIIQFVDMNDEPGIYTVDATITTNQGRTYKKQFRVKII